MVRELASAILGDNSAPVPTSAPLSATAAVLDKKSLGAHASKRRLGTKLGTKPILIELMPSCHGTSARPKAS